MSADLSKRNLISQKMIEFLAREYASDSESVDLVQVLKQWASGTLSGFPGGSPPFDSSREAGRFP